MWLDVFLLKEMIRAAFWKKLHCSFTAMTVETRLPCVGMKCEYILLIV